MFFRERRDGDGGVFAAERVVEENEVGEAAADAGFGALKRLEVCLVRRARLDIWS